MALQKAYTDPYGCDHPDAYWMLAGFAMDIPQQVARIEFLIYHSADAKDAGKPPLPNRLSFMVKADSEGLLPSFDDLLAGMDNAESGVRDQLYTLAKTLPELSAATDVIDPEPLPAKKVQG